MIERRRRSAMLRKSLAVLALIGSLGVVVAIMGSVLLQLVGDKQADSAPSTPRTPTAPASNIKPLPVRPVQDVRSPDECPPAQGPPPVLPASAVVTLCDMTRTAAYVLAPQVIELQLTRVDSVKSPVSEFYVVQVTMQPASATAFGDITAATVGRQLAFVRDGVVVSAPQITARIDSASLELSGDLTAQQADDTARLLRQPA